MSPAGGALTTILGTVARAALLIALAVGAQGVQAGAAGGATTALGDLGANLALGRSVTASSVQQINPGDEERYRPQAAVDGNLETRWSSAYRDGEWIQVDLGQRTTFNTVLLRWEAAYAVQWSLRVSDDGASWTNVFSTAEGKGGVERAVFAPVTARYLRLVGDTRMTEWGVSLWEVEVYHAPSLALTPAGKPEQLQAEVTAIAGGRPLGQESGKAATRRIGTGVAVVESASTAAFYGADSYRVLTGAAKDALAQAEIPFTSVTDEEVAAGALMRYAVAVLPSNATMDPAVAAAINEFIDAGGGVLAAYETSARNTQGKMLPAMQLGDRLKVKLVGWDSGPDKYSYILINQPGHPVFAGLPEKIPMARHMTFVAEPLAGGQVIGTWLNSDGKSASQAAPKDAAVIVTERTVYFSENIFDTQQNAENLTRLIANSVRYLLSQTGGGASTEEQARQELDTARKARETAREALARARAELRDVPYSALEQAVAAASQAADRAEVAWNAKNWEAVQAAARKPARRPSRPGLSRWNPAGSRQEASGLTTASWPGSAGGRASNASSINYPP